MKLVPDGREMSFIDVSAAIIPCSLLIKIVDRTYRMTFAYNEVGAFFTVNLELSSSGQNTPLVYGEALRYGKPLFEAYNDERYPLPVICPLCLTGEDISIITYDNFGKQVKLYLLPRPAGGVS